MHLKPIFKEILILVIPAVAIALAVNWISPAGIPLLGDWPEKPQLVGIGPQSGTEASGGAVQITSAAEAKSIYDRGEAIFVDARSWEQYEKGHIRGAVAMPVNEAEALLDDFFQRVPLQIPIVTYCSGRECIDSHRLAQLLMDAGYQNIKVYIDGFPGWIKEGFPVESGS